MRIIVLSDTHARTPDRLPQGLWQIVREADCVVHCGDYTGLSVVEEFQKQSKRFVGVYGNTDSGRIRDSLPTQQIFEVYGKRIAVLHPHDGGDPEGLELHLSAMFEGVDVILFGHSHEPYLKHGPPILLNPGQGYSQFLTPATLGILHITEERIQAEIVTLE